VIEILLDEARFAEFAIERESKNKRLLLSDGTRGGRDNQGQRQKDGVTKSQGALLDFTDSNRRTTTMGRMSLR
jgi:hypothetical protein